jgi:hypothetical protein
MAAILKNFFVLLLFWVLWEQSNAQQALSPIFAPQLKALQQNKDISWIGEGQVDFRLVPLYCADSFENNAVRILKMTSIDSMESMYNPYDFEPCEWIIEQIINDITVEKYVCFKDEELLQPFLNEKIVDYLFPIDTIPCCFCKDDEDGIKLARNGAILEEIPFIRLKFILYYNQKTRKFGNFNLSFAPLMMSKDDEGNKLGYKPMLWALLPEDNSSQASIFKNNDINYFIETSTRSTNRPVIANFINLKGNLDLKKVVQNDIKTPEKCVSSDNFQPETLDNLRRLTNPMDTIGIDWNPETNEISFDSIVVNHFEKRLTKICLMHFWYYDNKKHQLYCRLTATAPVLDIYDDEGNFRYSRPLYYREAEQTRGKKKIKKHSRY